MRNDSNHEQEWRDWIKLTKRNESNPTMTHEELLLYLYKQEKEENNKLEKRLHNAEVQASMWRSLYEKLERTYYAKIQIPKS